MLLLFCLELIDDHHQNRITVIKDVKGAPRYQLNNQKFVIKEMERRIRDQDSLREDKNLVMRKLSYMKVFIGFLFCAVNNHFLYKSFFMIRILIF